MQHSLLSGMTITSLREAYAKKILRPADVILNIIELAKRYADYNIWITPPSWDLVEPYLADIEKLDVTDIARYPLWGIPFSIKDNIDLAGIATTAACPQYAYTPSRDAAVVARLKSAGAIPVGKTNMDQFATGLVGTRSPYGECHNAWSPDLISGGSSSGSAVSLALSMVMFSLGSDTAGSGRVPAALNNIIGYKPPVAAWPNDGLVPACASLDCISVFALNVEDAMTVDTVITGNLGAVAVSAQSGEQGDAAPTKKDAAPTKKDAAPAFKTLYIPAEEPRFFGRFAADYEQRWQLAVCQAEAVANNLNAHVEKLDTAFLARTAELLYGGPMVAERWSSLGAFVQSHPGATLEVTESILSSGAGNKFSAVELFQALHEVAAARKKAAAILGDAVLMLPTTGGTFTRQEVREDPIATNSLLGLYTNHCNLCDLVAIALPVDDARITAATAGSNDSSISSGSDTTPFGVTLFSAAANRDLVVTAATAFLETR